MHMKFHLLIMYGILLARYYKQGDNSKLGDYVR